VPTLLEQAILRASNADGADRFGGVVAISGDRAIVGAPFENGPSNGLFDSGAAYVFERGGNGTWAEVALLRTSNADAPDRFGTSVAISGDRAIVGASREDGPSNGLFDSGTAYVFERDANGIWGTSDPGGFQTETALLRASNAGVQDQFGTSVAIRGDRAIVGARAEDGPSDDLSISGAAYVFERGANGTWTEVALLRASNAGVSDQFGISVALSGDRAIVGADDEAGPSDGLDFSGAAYVFERNANGTWGAPDPGGFQTETALLRASNAGEGDFFGRSVALSEDRAIVGAFGEDGPSDGLFDSGAAYVFERDANGIWGMSDPDGFQTETALLRASNAGDGDRFGTSVALSGDRAIVGADLEDSSFNRLSNSGAVYVFERGANGSWGAPDPGGFQTETVLLRASNAGVSDQFGYSVAIRGDRAIIGAFGESGPSNGVGFGSGAAYVFALPTDVSAASVSGPGLVQFGTTGTTIDFAAGTSGSGTVTVARFDGAAVGTDLLPEANVSNYRIVVRADPGLTVGTGTPIRFDVSTLDGVSVPGDVIIYTRPEPGAGDFTSAGPVTVDDNGTPGDPSDDALEVSVGGFSEFVFASDNPGNPLTVELAAFAARADEGRVVLSWETTSETENAGFAVERLTDGASPAPAEWSEIAFVEGAGTTDEPQRYEWVDARVPFAAEGLRYRLRQVDLDGTATLGPATYLQRTAPTAVALRALFPSPARGTATLRYELSESGPARIEIYNLLGQRVRTVLDRRQPGGRYEETLDLSGLASGTYVVRLTTGDTVQTERLTVVR
jgi:hypothetical protein